VREMRYGQRSRPRSGDSCPAIHRGGVIFKEPRPGDSHRGSSRPSAAPSRRPRTRARRSSCGASVEIAEQAVAEGGGPPTTRTYPNAAAPGRAKESSWRSVPGQHLVDGRGVLRCSISKAPVDGPKIHGPGLVRVSRSHVGSSTSWLPRRSGRSPNRDSVSATEQIAALRFTITRITSALRAPRGGV